MSKLYSPEGVDLLEAKKPQKSAVIMEADNGEKILFEQVAVAVMAPQVVNIIAEAVVKLLRENAPLGDDGNFHVDSGSDDALPNTSA